MSEQGLAMSGLSLPSPPNTHTLTHSLTHSLTMAGMPEVWHGVVGREQDLVSPAPPHTHTHYGRCLYVLPEVWRGVVGWEQDLAILFHQLGKVREQWVLLTKKVKLIVALYGKGTSSWQMDGHF